MTCVKSRLAKIHKTSKVYDLRCPLCNRILLTFSDLSLFNLIKKIYCGSCNIRVYYKIETESTNPVIPPMGKFKPKFKPSKQRMKGMRYRATSDIFRIKHTPRHLIINYYETDVRLLIAYTDELEQHIGIGSYYSDEENRRAANGS